MPNSKNNNRSRKKNSNKNRRGRKQRYSGPQMNGAPAGVAQDLEQFTKFYPASGSKGIRMHTCAAISEVIRASTPATVSLGLRQPVGAGMSMQLSLTEPSLLQQSGTAAVTEYVSPVFDLISSAFVRFRINKLIFHYEPQASATSDERLVFAFAEDPNHPVLWSSTVPTTNDLLALSDSIAFMPWRGWSMNVTSSLQDNLYYTYSDPQTTVSSVIERFSNFGVISLTGASVNNATESLCGVLYMEVDFTLEEFCPITTVSVSPSVLNRIKRNGNSKIGGPPKKSSVCSVCIDLYQTDKLTLCPSCCRRLPKSCSSSTCN